MRRKIYGFTLVEMVVVMFVIGVIIGLVILGTNYLEARARDATRKADMLEFKGALLKYREIYKTLPYPDSNLTNDCADQATNITGFISVNTCLKAVNLTQKDFADPYDIPPIFYRYAININKTDWEISTRLENTSDNELKNDCTGSFCDNSRYEVGQQMWNVDTSRDYYYYGPAAPGNSYSTEV